MRAAPWFAYDESALHCFSAAGVSSDERFTARMARPLPMPTSSSLPVHVLTLRLRPAGAEADAADAKGDAKQGRQPLSFDDVLAAVSRASDASLSAEQQQKALRDSQHGWTTQGARPFPPLLLRPNLARFGGQLTVLDYMCLTFEQRSARCESSLVRKGG